MTLPFSSLLFDKTNTGLEKSRAVQEIESLQPSNRNHHHQSSNKAYILVGYKMLRKYLISISSGDYSIKSWSTALYWIEMKTKITQLWFRLNWKQIWCHVWDWLPIDTEFKQKISFCRRKLFAEFIQEKRLSWVYPR